jgi:lysophospholipase L1-like esterase
MNPRKKTFFYGVLFLGLLIFTLGCLEIASRMTVYFFADVSKQITNHQTTLRRSGSTKPKFEAHPYLAYAPTDVVLTAEGCTIAGTSFTFDKPDNTLRVACLGGSTTKNAFPKFMNEPLQICFPNQKIEVMDWGCQGWTMAESTINYMIRAQDYSPDVIILHHGINDLAPRVRKDFVPDYSHYRKAFAYQGLLLLDRISAYSVFFAWMEIALNKHPGDLNTWTVNPNPGPVDHYPGEDTVRLYKNGIQTIAQLANENHAKLILAGMAYNPESNINQRNTEMLTEHNQIMKEMAEEFSIPFVEMQSVLQHYPDWFVDQCHLRNHGNKFKAQWLANIIADLYQTKPVVSVTKNETASAINIHWNFPTETYDTVAVHIQINGEKPVWLYTTNPNDRAFLWDASSNTTIKPEPGKTYKFIVWKILHGEQSSDAAVQSGTVEL